MVGVWNSLSLPLLTLLAGGVVFFRRQRPSLTGLGGGFTLFPLESFLIVFNLAVRFLSFYNAENQNFLPEWIDSYIYTDQLFYLERFGVETSYPQMESLSTGQSWSINLYHYLEYYLASWFKIFLNRTNYPVLFFCAIPFLISLAQIAVFRFFRSETRLGSIGLLLLILSAGTLFRFFHFGLPIELITSKANWFFQFYHFPLYKISTDFWVYFYNFYPKVPLFILLLVGITAALRTGNPFLHLFILLFSLYANMVFLPFLACWYLGHLYLSRRNWLWFGILPLSVALVFGIQFLLNLGRPSTPGAFFIPDFELVWSLKSSYRLLFKKFEFFMGNFFPLLLFFQAVRLLINPRSIWAWASLFYLLGFPAVFLKPDMLIQPWFLMGMAGFLVQVYLRRKTLFGEPFFLCLSTLNLVLWLLDIWLTFPVDYFQIHQMTLVGSLYMITFYHSARNLKPGWVAGILAVLFIIHNVESISFYFHRIYYREKSSAPFIEAFLRRTSGRMVHSAYISDNRGTPYIGLGKSGGDIKNVSDSLEQHFISLDVFTREDTLRIYRGYSWKIYQDKPMVQFYNRNRRRYPGFAESQRAFIRQNNISCLFRASYIDRQNMNFANPLLADSMLNEVEGYWVYFLKK